ncbi:MULTISPECIES: hypothetical protein [Halopseudomonas]|uniref:hypothetical protein n=1 Tax=Halopseudomonas TaxID=2901189 RepID=UPI0022B6291F|nr:MULTISPECIES: hypothetical protein [Halopseudomonas]
MIAGTEKPPFVNPGHLAASYVLPIAAPWFVVLFLLKEDPLLTLISILIFLSTLFNKTGRHLLQGKYIFKYAVIASSILHIFLGVAAFFRRKVCSFAWGFTGLIAYDDNGAGSIRYLHKVRIW